MQNERGEGFGNWGGNGDKGLEIRNGANREGCGHAGVHDDGGHPAVEKGDAPAEAAAQVEIFAAVVRIADGEFGEAERSGQREERHAAPDSSQKCR